MATANEPDPRSDPPRPAPDSADGARQRPGDVRENAGQATRSRLNAHKDEAADGLGVVADALRDAARRQGGDDSSRPAIAQLTGSAAEGLERLSSTLRSKDIGGMVRDVQRFAREQPVAFFGLSLAAGFVAARFLKASHD